MPNNHLIATSKSDQNASEPIKTTKKYNCEGCNYNPNASYFCGFCMKKILELEE